ncbi:MAG: hypothetical protein EOO66_28680 [Methylobacterium sp.]|nr:MAG: hypothetical protein EOO66_28680 [Methylobacterium sp.]
MPSPSTAVDSLVHVVVLWGVLMLFFRFYGSRVSTEAFTGGMRSLIHADLGSRPSVKRVMSTPVARRAVASSTYRGLRAIYSRPDPGVRENNLWLFRAGFTGLGALVAVIAALVWSGGFGPAPVPIGRILAHNAAVFAAVGLVEFVFISRCVMRMNPAPPSLMVAAAVDAARSAV